MIDLRHGNFQAEIGETGDPMPADTAGDDPGEMLKHRIDIQGHAMEGDPMTDANADRGNFGLALDASAGYRNPDADPTLPAFAVDFERCQRANDPLLKHLDIEPHI